MIPVGSANNIAETLGLEHAEPSELAAAWPEQWLLPFDVSEAVARWGQKRFVEAAGGGLVGEMFGTQKRNPRTRATTRSSTGSSCCATCLPRPAMRWELDLDGADLSGDWASRR